MFEGFRTQRVALTDSKINVEIGGAGPPLLLLHGCPQTHVIWHKIGPHLAKKFTFGDAGPARLRGKQRANS